MNINEFIREYGLKFADYLGDGLYVGYDGDQMILFAEREDSIHWVGLDDQTFQSLKRYGIRVQDAINEAKEIK